MIRAITLSSLLALALGVLASCVIEDRRGAPDRAITCGHFADFQQYCTSNCSITWSCEASYDSLDVDTQITLDDCSDCLAANLAGGICADCSDAYVGSCRQFMEDLLGVSCW